MSDEEDDAAWRADFAKVRADPNAGGESAVKIVSTVFLGVGLVLLLVSGGTFWYIRQSVAAEVTAPGVVLKNIVRSHTTRATNSSQTTTNDYYYPVVEFALADGTKKTVEMSEGNWPKAYDDGESVTVRYDPEHPLHARLGGGSAMDFFVPLLTGFMGAVFAAIAIGVRRAFAPTIEA